MSSADAPYESIWSDLQGVRFTQDYADAGGIETRYLRTGAPGRPAVIFLHGTGGHAEAYTRNLKAYGAHFDTFAIDMLGHGMTGKPDYDYDMPAYIRHLIGFMDAMGLEKATLSGESLGGWLAAHFAVAHPERVDKLVLNTAGGEMVQPKALGALRNSTRAAVEDPSWPRLKDRLEWLMYAPSDVHDDLIACRQRIYATPEMQANIHHLLCLHTIEARQRFALSKEQWAQIAQPTLVLWTSHDPTATVEVGEHLASLIPGCDFVVMDECGHWPQFEDPETFNRITLDFLLGRGVPKENPVKRARRPRQP
ncbi:MAG: alpha/beta fold hydrolase [Alphaproteobacteria bacterium]|nr:alpha/beta fold hydrolase [Alphaproteobacteria bacterium]